ncbi:hypothetical protein FRC04_011967 [Tulasnella sp. 424]|nr:hypothetical protein FRC04_011967 [Tulasnella sp. 424]KAG8971333.1 hypothetical protein FRC05_011325 [Tulasnella sp. 425]
MAEVFMHNIPFSATHVEVVRSLAEVLHNPPFYNPNDQLTNFHVSLHRGKRLQASRKHTGHGSLTLPNADLAALFLRSFGPSTFGRRRLRCEATRLIRFEESRYTPSPEVVALIQSTPYVDPLAQEERDERANQLRAAVKITQVQFGWQCRDGLFSVEWTSSLPTNMNSPPSLGFQEETNEIWVSMGGGHDASPDDIGTLITNVVVFRFSRVESLAYDTSSGAHPAILFSFQTPPAFEMHRTPSLVGSALPSSPSQGRRTRLTSFSPSHETVAPYTSLAMRVVCDSRKDLAEFQRMAEVANLPSAVELAPPPPGRGLFTVGTLDRVHRWIAKLPYVVGFQALAILNNLHLDPLELWELRPHIMFILNEHGIARTSEILRLFGPHVKTLGWDSYLDTDDEPPQTIEDCLRRATKDTTPLHMALRDQSKNPGWFNCHHVTVTPTRIVLDGPYPDQSNRVLRRYSKHHDYFLRVNFTDEDLLDFRWDRDVDGAQFVRERVGGVLKRGLTVAGRKFDFLAYSSSALKEHAVWFCAEFIDDKGEKWNANTIRQSLGDFSHLERYPARYGARMSQAFTATEPGITLQLDEIVMTPDIKRNGSNFTDGVGDISKYLAKKISRRLQRRPGSKKRFYLDPSAYQFRMDGFKGMIAVNHRLEGLEIRLRDSQRKFGVPQPSMEIEIAQSFWRPKPVYLNRYMIMILETLGVPARVFIKLQDEAVREVDEATQTLTKCSKFLDAHGIGTSYRLSSVMLNLNKLKVGLRSETAAALNLNDPFLDRAIEFAANHVLRVMKHKARIPVKGSYTLVGVVDVHGWLQPNEVFVCIQKRDEKPEYIQGKVLITRSPQVHPGDVQFVEAIGHPPPGSPFTFEKFPNCVVFSSLGDRCIPSMLSGGDLDGDEYNVILYQDLFPSKTYPPAAYPPAIIKELDRTCTIDDLADWVAEYINSDILGFVADQFLHLADQSPLMARDPDCVKLAELASKAVDFAKSGTPVSRADIPRLRFPSYQKPDWSAGEVGTGRNGRLVYKSNRAIGQLFRRIDLNDADRLAAREARRQRGGLGQKAEKKAEAKLERAMKDLTITGPARDVLGHPISLALLPVLRKHIDAESAIPEELTTVARKQFGAYVSELRFIANSNTITWEPLTEEEIFMGTIASKTSQPRKRTSMMARLRNQTDELVKRIQAELAGDKQDALDLDSDEEIDEDLEDWLLRSWAAWQVSVLRDTTFGGKSFGFVALRSIFECLKEIEDRDERRSHVG